MDLISLENDSVRVKLNVGPKRGIASSNEVKTEFERFESFRKECKGGSSNESIDLRPEEREREIFSFVRRIVITEDRSGRNRVVNQGRTNKGAGFLLLSAG